MRKVSHALSSADVAVREDLEHALEQLDILIDKVRRISHNLSPAILEDLGLEAALESLVRDFSADEEVEFSLDLEKVSSFLSQTVQLAVYRIFQEALTNISKHAAASEVNMQISRGNDHIRFLIGDNGRGFDLEASKTAAPGERGVGLASIEERVHLLNGVLEIRSQPGQGTQLSFALPYESSSS